MVPHLNLSKKNKINKSKKVKRMKGRKREERMDFLKHGSQTIFWADP
jgi:hypothetical protein